MKTLDLIVPCFNEEEALPLFNAQVKQVMDNLIGYRCTLIFVDDGSRDGTLSCIKGFALSDSRVRYLSFSRNFGKEAAMLAGLRASTGELVGILDADLQHSPTLLPEMLSALESGYDVAAAKRTDRAGEGRLKSRLSDRFYHISEKMTGLAIEPGAQDFRVMKRTVVNAILSMPEHQRFTKGIFAFVGFQTKWIPHENAARAAGESKWTYRKLFSYAVDGLLGYSDKLLRLPLYCGAVLTLCGVLAAVVLLVLRLCGAALTAVYPVLCCLVLLGGLVLLSIGVVGVYLARVYEEVKARPVYIVKETNLIDRQI